MTSFLVSSDIELNSNWLKTESALNWLRKLKGPGAVLASDMAGFSAYTGSLGLNFFCLSTLRPSVLTLFSLPI